MLMTLYFSSIAWLHLISNLLTGMGRRFWYRLSLLFSKLNKPALGFPDLDPFFVNIFLAVFQMMPNQCRAKISNHFCCCSASPFYWNSPIQKA